MPNQFTDADRRFSLKLIKLWTSFARNGKLPRLKPSNLEWPISNSYQSKPRYVEINNRFTREYKFEFEQRCNELWKPVLSIYKK